MSSKKIYKKIVIKIGSSVLTDNTQTFLRKNIERLSEEVLSLVKENYEIVLVSSGAIALGCSYLKIKKRPKDIVSLQATAALGQGLLIETYNEVFRRQNKFCGQVLLTWEDFDKRQRFLNAKNTISKLLELGIIPIINENDVVSVDEIKFGDNDKLSALVANLIAADLLVILSDVDGLYKKDKQNLELIPLVEEITSDIEKLACLDKGDLCVGGMSTKLEAIKLATSSGVPCVIANGKKEKILSKIINAEAVGTFFLPQRNYLAARKRWIAFSTKTKGVLIVDEGAYEALVKKGKSLLSPGIISVEGEFKKGDIVSVLNIKREEFAKGRVDCDAGQLQNIKGQRFHKEIIHRDNLVIL